MELINDILHRIDWGHIATALISLLVGLSIKTLLDLHLGDFLVRYFHWLPVRTVFRKKPVKINGIWDQQWQLQVEDIAASKFKTELSRHSNITLRQLGDYCNGEFYSNGNTYSVFGQVKGEFFYGHWYDKKDNNGYSGTFELRIINSSEMLGRWLGHSQRHMLIHTGEWIWSKIH